MQNDRPQPIERCIKGRIPTLAAMIAACLIGGCDWTDAATRLAADIETGAGRLGRSTGARHTIEHRTPSKDGQCVGPYKVQLDKVGALIVWCKDEAGNTVSSHSTSTHARHVDAPQTYIIEKTARSPLLIDLERRDGRAVVTGLR